jgi:hypothetical protein
MFVEVNNETTNVNTIKLTPICFLTIFLIL